MGWTPPHLSASMCQTEIDISVNDKEESAMKINRVGVDLAPKVGAMRRKMFFNYTVWIATVKRSGSYTLETSF